MPPPVPGPRRAYSLVEILVGVILAFLVCFGLMQLLGTGRKMEDVLGAHLALQADARKALMSFIRDLQEGMIVVRPAPGQTLPCALVKDKLERLVFYSLAPGKEPGLFDLRRDLATPAGTERKTILTGVSRVSFTSTSDSLIQLHLDLGEGKQRYAFATEVRLRNRDAADPF